MNILLLRTLPSNLWAKRVDIFEKKFKFAESGTSFCSITAYVR